MIYFYKQVSFLNFKCEKVRFAFFCVFSFSVNMPMEYGWVIRFFVDFFNNNMTNKSSIYRIQDKYRALAQK